MEADIFRKVYSQVSIRWGVWNSTGGWGGGVLENISKTNSQGGRKNLENLTAGGGGAGLEFRFFFLSFLTIKTIYCRAFYIQ